MIDISKLYCGTAAPSDALRYGHHLETLPSHLLRILSDKRPVVIWNVTNRCNLKCVHCYDYADNHAGDYGLKTMEGRELINDLAGYGVPALLFSGGEPFARPDLPELAAYAVENGMRAVISTNGTRITSEKARILKDIGLSYVSISLDGMEEVHDRFRGVYGAYAAALDGIRNSRAAGIEVGLRFTINKYNVGEIPGIFDLLEEMDIPRICFYHLVYAAGRGSERFKQGLTHEETRKAVDLIVERTKDFYKRGIHKDVLTAGNRADGPYLYWRLLKENPERAEEVLELLKMDEENSSELGIGCVNWNGSVYADPFWRHHSFGNIRKLPFSKIWSDSSDPLRSKLKERKNHVTGRCAACNWLDICAGNSRARAEALTGDIWAPDPACYLTDEEISETSL
ncbi:MAG: radical SAM protein [Desulfobacterales bacterium]